MPSGFGRERPNSEWEYQWEAVLADTLEGEILPRKEITTEKWNAEPEGTVVGKTFLTFLTSSPAIK